MLTNRRITEIKSLSQKRSRVELGEFVCEGVKICYELHQNRFPISELYYTTETDTILVDKIAQSGAICTLINGATMARLSQLKSAPTMLAICPTPHYKLPQPQNNELIIALDSVQDPGNMGTIIRVADWFGVKRVVCSEDCADALSPKVIQATMGAIARVEVHYTDLTKYLSTTTLPIYGTFLEGENIYKKELTKGGILLMGNEGRGISEQNSKLVTDKLFIPPFPIESQSVESLNVAVATSICLSEFRRDR